MLLARLPETLVCLEDSEVILAGKGADQQET
jgi:hypothetical protein